MNIALVLSYDGTHYHGWQIQKNAATIQQTLQDALEKLLGFAPTVSGVGRTDAGVHAKRYVANFKADCSIPIERLSFALNSFLPQDIAVLGAAIVPDSFDARFNCTKKEYAYDIFPSALPDPFLASRSYRCTYPLDISKMQQAAKHFVGTHDFASVRSQGTPVKSTVRTIFHLEVEQINSLIRIRVCGDGFLYNMVRAISGTLLYAGNGKFSPDEIPEILQSANRENAGPTLPPEGLYMNRLWYEKTPELDCFALDK